MNFSKALICAVALASLTLTACVGAAGDDEEQVGTAEQRALSINALSINALSINALSINALSINALSINALSINGLQGDPLVKNALTDPNAREVFKYIVSCALPASAEVKVTNSTGTYSFDGGLGLAPEWGYTHGSCDDQCKEWVSACVISRLDYLGQPKEISLRGDNPGLKTSFSERATYNQSEATYYGDIFSVPQRLYACLAPGKTEIPRVCGPSITNCGVDVVGKCTDVCGFQQLDGSFPNCSVPSKGHGGGHGGGHGFGGIEGCEPEDVYFGSISVFNAP